TPGGTLKWRLPTGDRSAIGRVRGERADARVALDRAVEGPDCPERRWSAEAHAGQLVGAPDLVRNVRAGHDAPRLAVPVLDQGVEVEAVRRVSVPDRPN